MDYNQQLGKLYTFHSQRGVNPTGMAPGSYNGQVILTDSSGAQTISVSLTVAPDLRPVITSVVNGASFKPGVGSGSWISILGNNFANKSSIVSVPFLPSVNGVSAQISGVGGAYSLLIYYLSPTQINAFVPLELAQSLFGSGSLQHTSVTTSEGVASFTTPCQTWMPGLFNYGTQAYASATHIDGSIAGVIAGTSPAQSGTIITLWGTGFGQTAPATSAAAINYLSSAGGVF